MHFIYYMIKAIDFKHSEVLIHENSDLQCRQHFIEI